MPPGEFASSCAIARNTRPARRGVLGARDAAQNIANIAPFEGFSCANRGRVKLADDVTHRHHCTSRLRQLGYRREPFTVTPPLPSSTDILIVGGGLAGLSLCESLADLDHQLLESRARFGGRIHSPHLTAGTLPSARFDLGPSWFWPGQPRMAALTQRLGLRVYEQYATGALTYEDERGEVHRGRGVASMAGSLRIDGGMGAMIDGLVARLDADRLHLGQRLVRLRDEGTHVVATVAVGDQPHEIQAARVVLALPPRIAAALVRESLPADVVRAMDAVPTWMAGHAKVLATYTEPHWRNAGLSGDAMSRRGPLVEVHDASPAAGGPYALFGFVGTPAAGRDMQRDALLDAAREQLTRLFDAPPDGLALHDWAFEPETATALDHAPLYEHPAYGLAPALTNLWNGRLMLGSTETGVEFGGYLEGALEAAERVARLCRSS